MLILPLFFFAIIILIIAITILISAIIAIIIIAIIVILIAIVAVVTVTTTVLLDIFVLYCAIIPEALLQSLGPKPEAQEHKASLNPKSETPALNTLRPMPTPSTRNPNPFWAPFLEVQSRRQSQRRPKASRSRKRRSSRLDAIRLLVFRSSESSGLGLSDIESFCAIII